MAAVGYSRLRYPRAQYSRSLITPREFHEPIECLTPDPAAVCPVLVDDQTAPRMGSRFPRRVALESQCRCSMRAAPSRWALREIKPRLIFCVYQLDERGMEGGQTRPHIPQRLATTECRAESPPQWRVPAIGPTPYPKHQQGMQLQKRRSDHDSSLSRSSRKCSPAAYALSGDLRCTMASCTASRSAASRSSAFAFTARVIAVS